jgi:ribosomal protein S4
MLNLKSVVVKTDNVEPQHLRLDASTPGPVLAGDIELPAGVKIVNHAHVLVNGKKVDIPSYLLKEGDVVTIKENSKQFIKSVIESIDLALSYAWLTVDANELKITFDRIPNREELDPDFKEQLVIEYYSK